MFPRQRCAAFVFWATASQAQIRPYGVAEAGVERRRLLTDAELIAPAAGTIAPPYHKDGFAYGIAIGAEAPASSVLFVGTELSASRSEVNTEAKQLRGIQLNEGLLIGVVERTRVHPRWNYAVTARAGVNVTRSLALYGLAGLAGERVRRDFDSGINDIALAPTLSTNQSFDGFTYGAGARLFVSDHFGVRA